jgi:hypothetical protein
MAARFNYRFDRTLTTVSPRRLFAKTPLALEGRYTNVDCGW